MRRRFARVSQNEASQANFHFKQKLSGSHCCIGSIIRNNDLLFLLRPHPQNRNNKRTEIERFDWFIEGIQTRVAFGWLSEHSVEKTSWPMEQCLLHTGGKRKRPCLDLFIHCLINKYKRTLTKTIFRGHTKIAPFKNNKMGSER